MVGGLLFGNQIHGRLSGYTPLLLIAVSGLLLACSPPLLAQVSTADLLGTVTDPSGAVVPNAQVTLTNTATRQKRQAPTNPSGEYIFSLLQRGRYSITVNSPGFKNFILDGITLNAGDRERQDVSMVLGENSEKVEV